MSQNVQKSLLSRKMERKRVALSLLPTIKVFQISKTPSIVAANSEKIETHFHFMQFLKT